MSDYDMANSDAGADADEPTIEPRIERDDTDGGAGAGAEPEATGVTLPDDEPVELDDDGLEETDAEMDGDLGLGMGDDPGDDGNPLLQQNL
jgi:hypothetical protein